MCEGCESTVNPSVLLGPADEQVDPPFHWQQGELCLRCHLRIHAQVPETDLPLFGFMSAADMVRYFQDATPPDIAQYQREEEQRFGNSLMQEFLAFKRGFF
jgi:hypothetical protein